MVILTLLQPQTHQPIRQWRFEQETLIRIGRASDNHVILHYAVVSRFHAELRQVDLPVMAGAASTPVSWQLINHSVNGTYINGAAIAQFLLADTTLIQLAQAGPLIRFEVHQPGIAPNHPPQAPMTHPPPANASASAVSSSSKPALLRRWFIPPRCAHTGNPEGTLFCIHCGQPIHVEKIVRQYQLLRVLGRGGMGTTYLVWNSSGVPRPRGFSQGKLQVLKEMNADIVQIPKAQELFEREAQTLKTLKHSGIPRYYDFFIDSGKKYLVMELIHGQDLEKYVRHKGPVPLDTAIAWMIQTCEILDYLHTRPEPMIHRDVKPGNLLLRHSDQRIVLLDFGAVKAAGMPPGTRIGAEGYSAPEQIQGRPVTQSDLYAIGPSLIFLLTGMSALRFYRRTETVNRLDLDKISGLPRRLQLVIWRVTEPNPRDRYQTAQELMQALKGCLS